MKALFLVLLVLIFHSTADASGLDDCDKIGDLASIVMWTRQDNTPVSDIRKVGDDINMTPDQRQAFMFMITKAYEVPLFRTKESKITAIGEFRDKWTITCYESMNKSKW